MKVGRTMWLRTGQTIKKVKLLGIKKSFWSGKTFLVFENEKIPLSQAHTNVFFSLRGACEATGANRA